MEAVEVNGKPGLWVRLILVSAYAIAGGVLAWRALTYDAKMEPYPVLAIVMCSCLIAVLYTLSVLTLAGRSVMLDASEAPGLL